MACHKIGNEKLCSISDSYQETSQPSQMKITSPASEKPESVASQKTKGAGKPSGRLGYVCLHCRKTCTSRIKLEVCPFCRKQLSNVNSMKNKIQPTPVNVTGIPFTSEGPSQCQEWRSNVECRKGSSHPTSVNVSSSTSDRSPQSDEELITLSNHSMCYNCKKIFPISASPKLEACPFCNKALDRINKIRVKERANHPLHDHTPIGVTPPDKYRRDNDGREKPHMVPQCIKQTSLTVASVLAIKRNAKGQCVLVPKRDSPLVKQVCPYCDKEFTKGSTNLSVCPHCKQESHDVNQDSELPKVHTIAPIDDVPSAELVHITPTAENPPLENIKQTYVVLQSRKDKDRFQQEQVTTPIVVAPPEKYPRDKEGREKPHMVPRHIEQTPTAQKKTPENIKKTNMLLRTMKDATKSLQEQVTTPIGVAPPDEYLRDKDGREKPHMIPQCIKQTSLTVASLLAINRNAKGHFVLVPKRDSPLEKQVCPYCDKEFTKGSTNFSVCPHCKSGFLNRNQASEPSKVHVIAPSGDISSTVQEHISTAQEPTPQTNRQSTMFLQAKLPQVQMIVPITEEPLAESNNPSQILNPDTYPMDNVGREKCKVVPKHRERTQVTVATCLASQTNNQFFPQPEKQARVLPHGHIIAPNKPLLQNDDKPPNVSQLYTQKKARRQKDCPELKESAISHEVTTSPKVSLSCLICKAPFSHTTNRPCVAPHINQTSKPSHEMYTSTSLVRSKGSSVKPVLAYEKSFLRHAIQPREISSSVSHCEKGTDLQAKVHDIFPVNDRLPESDKMTISPLGGRGKPFDGNQNEELTQVHCPVGEKPPNTNKLSTSGQDVKFYACPHCDIKYDSQQVLNRHLPSHKPKNNNACVRCDKAFSSFSKLDLCPDCYTHLRCSSTPIKQKAKAKRKSSAVPPTGKEASKPPPMIDISTTGKEPPQDGKKLKKSSRPGKGKKPTPKFRDELKYRCPFCCKQFTMPPTSFPGYCPHCCKRYKHPSDQSPEGLYPRLSQEKRQKTKQPHGSEGVMSSTSPKMLPHTQPGQTCKPSESGTMITSLTGKRDTPSGLPHDANQNDELSLAHCISPNSKCVTSLISQNTQAQEKYSIVSLTGEGTSQPSQMLVINPTGEAPPEDGNTSEVHIIAPIGDMSSTELLHIITPTGEDPSLNTGEETIQPSKIHIISLSEEKCTNLNMSTKLVQDLPSIHIQYESHRCNKTYSNFSKLDKHMCNYKMVPHICSHCGKVYNSLSALRRHILIHSSEKPLEFAVCDKEFSLELQLKGTFRCPRCERGFLSSSELRKHIDTHLCPHCGKGFCCLHMLAAHKQSHRVGANQQVNTHNRGEDVALQLGKDQQNPQHSVRANVSQETGAVVNHLLPSAYPDCEACIHGFTQRGFLEAHLAMTHGY